MDDLDTDLINEYVDVLLPKSSRELTLFRCTDMSSDAVLKTTDIEDGDDWRFGLVLVDLTCGSLVSLFLVLLQKDPNNSLSIRARTRIASFRGILIRMFRAFEMFTSRTFLITQKASFSKFAGFKAIIFFFISNKSDQ